MEERSARGLRKEAVEGEAIALLFEGEATFDQFGIGIDVLEDFEHGAFGPEQGDEAFGEDAARAVDEGSDAAGIRDEEQPVVDDLAGGLIRVAGEAIGFAVAIQELVAEEVAMRVKDGLAAEETAGR